MTDLLDSYVARVLGPLLAANRHHDLAVAALHIIQHGPLSNGDELAYLLMIVATSAMRAGLDDEAELFRGLMGLALNEPGFADEAVKIGEQRRKAHLS